MEQYLREASEEIKNAISLINEGERAAEEIKPFTQDALKSLKDQLAYEVKRIEGIKILLGL